MNSKSNMPREDPNISIRREIYEAAVVGLLTAGVIVLIVYLVDPTKLRT